MSRRAQPRQPSRSYSLPRQRRALGMTLLELLVAFAIMAMALGMFYRSLGGSAASVGQMERYQGAVMTAQSLLSLRDSVPAGGWNEAGESAGYRWQASSQPYPTGLESGTVPALFQVTLLVQWNESVGPPKSLQLTTLRPERATPQVIRP